MNKRIELLAGLIEEDDFEDTRHEVLESYEEQIDEDVKIISENVALVEDSERLNKLIGQEDEIEPWIGEKPKEKPMTALEEGRMLGLVGAGVLGGPSIEEIDGNAALGAAIHGGGFGETRDSGYEPPVFEGGILDWALGNGPRHQMSEAEMFKMNADDALLEKEEQLKQMINNGEVAVRGGIGPGFEAFDGRAREPLDVFRGSKNTMERWYMKESETEVDITEGPENPKWNWKSEEPTLKEMGEFDKEGGELPGEMGEELPEDEEASYSERNIHIDPQLALRVMDWHGGQFTPTYSLASTGFAGEPVSREMIENTIDELGSTFSRLDPEDENREELAGLIDELGMIHMDESVQKKGDSLNERLEAVDGNAWPNRRTGNTDGDYVRFREDPYDNNPPGMHQDAPEQPKVGYPAGYTFYENSPEAIRINRQKADPLDLAEIDSVEEAFQKFFKKYSVYNGKKKANKSKLSESVWDYKFLLVEYKNPILGTYDSLGDYLAAQEMDEREFIASVQESMSELGELTPDDMADVLDVYEQVMQLAQRDGNVNVFINLKKAAETIKGMMNSGSDDIPVDLDRNARRTEFVQRIRELADSAERNYNPKQMSRDLTEVIQRYLGKSGYQIVKVLTKNEMAQLSEVRYNLKIAHRRGDAAFEAWNRFENGMRELAGMVEAGQPPVTQPRKTGGRRKKNKILPTIQPSQREKREPQEEMSLYEMFINEGWINPEEIRFPHIWKELMDSVEAAVEAGEPRAEVMRWAHSEYDDYESQMSSMAASEAGEFDEPTFDVQGRF